MNNCVYCTGDVLCEKCRGAEKQRKDSIFFTALGAAYFGGGIMIGLYVYLKDVFREDFFFKSALLIACAGTLLIGISLLSISNKWE